MRGHMVLSNEARAYKAAAGLMARQVFTRPIDGPVSVTIHVYVNRVNADLENRGKCAIDSLNGIAFHDDKQITELHLYKHLDRKAPRIEVQVSRL